MADNLTTDEHGFPEGTLVGAYLTSDTSVQSSLGVKPLGAAEDTDYVADGELSYELDPGSWQLAAPVNGLFVGGGTNASFVVAPKEQATVRVELVDPGANNAGLEITSPVTVLDDDEVQVVTVSDASGGTFTLTFEDQETSGIAYNAASSAIDTALEGLSNIGSGDISVTGDAGGPWTISFGGSLADMDVAELVADGSSLEGEGADVTVETTTAGDPGLDLDRTVQVSLATDGSGDITSTAQEVVNALSGVEATRGLLTAELADGHDGTGVVATEVAESSGGKPGWRYVGIHVPEEE